MPALDATLPAWSDLADQYPCETLLVGNGASRAFWKPFGYFSLYEEAQRAGRKKGLAISDQALFKSLGTELFEPVLTALNTTVRTNAALAINSTAPLNRYYSIKEALIHAVRTVHMPWSAMPEAALTTLNQALRGYRNVYTSNYDLLLVWAVQHDPKGFAELFDEQGFFDVRRTTDKGTRVLHLHGGMHLLKLPDGTTRQRSASSAEMLEGFAVNVPGEVPLFVNEERSDEKLRAIRHSDYLSWSLGQLACSASIWTATTGTCSKPFAQPGPATWPLPYAHWERHRSSIRSVISPAASKTCRTRPCTSSTPRRIRWGWQARLCN